VRKLNQGGDQTAGKAKKPINKDPDTLRLEQTLSDAIGAPVAIKHTPQGKGELSIRYSSLDELDGILKHLGIAD
jgi:ParB family chromosome partitioning protein